MATTSLNRGFERSEIQRNSTHLSVNIDWPERLASIGAGVRLLSGGLKNIIKHPVRNGLMAAAGGYLVFRGVTGNCPIYSLIYPDRTNGRASNVNIRTSVTVNRPRMEVYNFWRRLENLPLFMTHLSRVEKIDAQQSRWEAKLPGNIAHVGWVAEIVNDDPGNVIGWHSVQGSDIENAGKVEFSESADGRSTTLKVTISYHPPAGTAGEKVAHLLNPVFEKLVKDDIRNFKSFMEHRSAPALSYSETVNPGDNLII